MENDCFSESDRFTSSNGQRSGESRTIGRSQRRQTAFLVFIILVPVLLLAVLAGFEMVRARSRYDQNELVKRSVQAAELTRNLLVELQKERGLSCLFLSLPRRYLNFPPKDTASQRDNSSTSEERRSEVLAKLTAFRINTDSKLDSWRKTKPRQTALLTQNLIHFRASIDRGSVDCDQTLKWYTDVNKSLADSISQLFRDSTEGSFWSDVHAYLNIIWAKDLIGIKRAIGSSIFTSGDSGPGKLTRFAEVNGAAKNLFGMVNGTVAIANDVYQQLVAHNRALIETLDYFELQIKEQEIKPDSQKAVEWFDNMTEYIGIVSEVESQLSSLVLHDLDVRMANQHNEFLIRVIVLCINIFFCPLLAVAYAVHSRRLVRRSADLAAKRARARADKRRTEFMLNKFVPVIGHIVKECKCDQKETAENLMVDIRAEIVAQAWDTKRKHSELSPKY